MSKKNKKNKSISLMSWDDMFGVPDSKEGDLRFFQKNTIIAHKKWWGVDEEERRGQKILQRFDGKDWKDIPFETEYDYVD